MAQNQKDLLPVYALIGTNKLRQKNVLSRLSERLKQYGDMSFNSDQFDGDIASGPQIIQACMQAPFASPKRYILVKNADKLNKNDTEVLTKYIEKPCSTTILVLCFNKLAKNTKLYKTIGKISQTCYIDCQPPKKYQIAQSLNDVARRHNGGINFDAAQKLVELIGEDTMHLDSEIQKLLIANGGTNITLEQVLSQVSKTAEIKPWDFTNAFADKDLNTCLEQFKQMPAGSEYQLLPQVCRIIKELICVHDLGSNASQQSISYALGYEAWRVKNHMRWAHKWSKEELINALSNALDCEIKMKSTSDSALSFETYIIESLKLNTLN